MFIGSTSYCFIKFPFIFIYFSIVMNSTNIEIVIVAK